MRADLWVGPHLLGGETVADGGWDLALAGVLVIVLGIAVIAIPELWSPVGVFVIGVGAGPLQSCGREGG